MKMGVLPMVIGVLKELASGVVLLNVFVSGFRRVVVRYTDSICR